MANDKYANEQLSDDELDKVAGGLSREKEEKLKDALGKTISEFMEVFNPTDKDKAK